MTTYRLKDDGYAWKVIYSGRVKVGRVYRHADGSYRAVLSGNEVQHATEAGAFRLAASQALGFASVEALRENNARARAVNRARKQHARHVVHEMLRGNFDGPLDGILKRGKI